MAQSNQSQPGFNPAAANIRAIVRDPEGSLVSSDVSVSLRNAAANIELELAEDNMQFVGKVPAGEYQIEVKSADMQAPPQTVRIDANGKAVKTTCLYLGKPDWPFYRLGQCCVPFEPPGDKLAVAFPMGTPDDKQMKKLMKEVREALPVELRKMEEDKPKDEAAVCADGAMLMLRFTEKVTPKLCRQADEKIKKMTGDMARVGVVVDDRVGSLKAIDNQFVCRFKDGVSKETIEECLQEASASLLRKFRHLRNTYLVKFPVGMYEEYLAVIEKWYARDLLVYGEPDIMAEITDDVFPDDPPNDPTYASQANLTLQNVDTAWRILNAGNADHTLGSPDVYVASLDRGLDTDHPDIGGNLTDGAAQVARCYDFSGLRECTVAGYEPDTSHGMGVYGIIAAVANNNNDVAGIAPNTRQIVMERPSLTSANYPDVLLWAAGFETGNSSTGWPAEPLPDGAHIISCSHGSNGLALSGIMDDTLQMIADDGRGGLGTLIVYSAGNDNTLITGFRTWAAHGSTMAIANSAQPDGGGVERKVGTSNFGPEIDVCAQGAGAPSLDHLGGEQNFGGTSAAAPTVAAVAALMLSADSSLTRVNLRDRLRNTAVQIDAANTDPVGQWIGGFSQWYGFGRINAASAVCGVDPQVVLDTPSINFNDIPEDETTVRAASFTVTSCEPVTLELISGPGAAFSLPLGSSVNMGIAADMTPRSARIWIAYTGTSAGLSDTGSVTIRWVETGQEWVIPIVANTVERPTAAVSLVLDKSGSMDWDSGIPSLPKRVDVLKFSVPPLLEVMHESNGIGIVSFDTDAQVEMAVTDAGVPVFGAGRAAAKTVVDNHVPNPAGATAIGDGLEVATTQLSSAGAYDAKSIIVLTDGHETAEQYIADVDHLINDRVFAIGLGNADTIQPTALTSLTNGTGGYILLTGDLGANDQFLLAKYYLQILAGVNNEDVVVDPQGYVQAGQKHRIPFILSETDISSDVILLSPFPEGICFSLESPFGDVITPASVSAIPNAQFVNGQHVSYYRFSLPVAVGAGVAAGQWHAILELDDAAYKRYLGQLREKQSPLFESAAIHGIPYSLNVHAYSNLRMRCQVSQSGYEPGASMTLTATLTEYGLPVDGRATVRAVVTRPDGTETTLPLVDVGEGRYELSQTASASGVYRFRVLASGHSLRQTPFTREQIVTAAVWRNGNQPPPRGGSTSPSDEALHGLICCLLGHALRSDKIQEYLKTLEIDATAIRRCVESYCSGRRATPSLSSAISAEQLSVLRQPQVLSALRQMVDAVDA